jgi:hypothetical protein
VARLVRNLLPTGFLYGSPKPDFAQTVPTQIQGDLLALKMTSKVIENKIELSAMNMSQQQ